MMQPGIESGNPSSTVREQNLDTPTSSDVDTELLHGTENVPPVNESTLNGAINNGVKNPEVTQPKKKKRVQPAVIPMTEPRRSIRVKVPDPNRRISPSLSHQKRSAGVLSQTNDNNNDAGRTLTSSRKRTAAASSQQENVQSSSKGQHQNSDSEFLSYGLIKLRRLPPRQKTSVNRQQPQVLGNNEQQNQNEEPPQQILGDIDQRKQDEELPQQAPPNGEQQKQLEQPQQQIPPNDELPQQALQDGDQQKQHEQHLHQALPDGEQKNQNEQPPKQTHGDEDQQKQLEPPPQQILGDGDQQKQHEQHLHQALPDGEQKNQNEQPQQFNAIEGLHQIQRRFNQGLPVENAQNHQLIQKVADLLANLQQFQQPAIAGQPLIPQPIHPAVVGIQQNVQNGNNQGQHDAAAAFPNLKQLFAGAAGYSQNAQFQIPQPSVPNINDLLPPVMQHRASFYPFLESFTKKMNETNMEFARIVLDAINKFNNANNE